MANLGIVYLSVIPVRKLPQHQSEMISQALFGEVFRIIQSDESWTKIKLTNDNYEGWIQANQWLEIESDKIISSLKINQTNLCQVHFNKSSIHLPLASNVWLKVEDCPILSQFKFPKNIKTTERGAKFTKEQIIQTAEQFLGSPYLWGGKTSLGIDCSGLTQVTFLANGFQLPRDAYQQAEIGTAVPFSEIQKGDLAFFKNKSDKISHVGIIHSVSDDNIKIIHASGRVKIEVLDKIGIINSDLNTEEKYSHSLAFLKRII